MERFDIVYAVFKPKQTDDLKPGVSDWIGYRGLWQAMWMVDEEDGGSYVGQWAMGIYDRLDPPPPFVWVPRCDLEIHEFMWGISDSELPADSTQDEAP